MHEKKLHLLLGFALSVLPFSSRAADVAQGQALFQSQCARCHLAGPSTFHAMPDSIAAQLQGGRLPGHRIVLSGSALDDLNAFLRQASKLLNLST